MTTRKKKTVAKPETPDSLNIEMSGVEPGVEGDALSLEVSGVEPVTEVDSEPLKTHFPIVGIGASAGGLAAFEAFFSGMPADKNPDMAFVLIAYAAHAFGKGVVQQAMPLTKAEDALKKIFILILMDVQMPLLNGFEATGAIREKERTRGGHIPIVAMTAHALKKDEDKCLDAGMDAYISKPIDFKNTIQVIGETLKIKKAAAEEMQKGDSGEPPLS